MELSDLIADYPSPDTPGIQTIVTEKKEFFELASEPSEPVPLPGQKYKHQTLIARYMNMADRMFLIHDPGTGKTCTVVGLAEYLRRQYEAGKSRIRHAYLVTKGPSTIQDIKTQILCKCTNKTYLTKLITEATNESSRKSNITRELSKWYTIQTYQKFVNSIEHPRLKSRDTSGKVLKKELPPLTDEQIIEKFSDTLIFVDEVHNLHPGNPPAPDDDTVEVIARKTEKEELQRAYTTFFRVFHLVPRCKIVLASATPMINDANELIPIMNLILPLTVDHPMPYDTNGVDGRYSGLLPDSINLLQATLNDVEPYFRGKISYVRGLDTGAQIVYEGERIGGIFEDDGREVAYQTIVYGTEMQDIQLKGYERAVEAEQRRRGTATSAFHSGERQATCFVFPDYSYGGTIGLMEGMGKYVERVQADLYRAKPELQAYLTKPAQLARLSCKYSSIVDLVRKEDKGTCFCYTDFMNGSGAIVLGLTLEAQGFTRFAYDHSVFRSASHAGLAPLCGPALEETHTKERDLLIPKTPYRYALLTSDTTPARQAAIMEAFNSYENRHGEIIKVLIGSPLTRDGINLSHVVQVHIITPAWHQSGMYQAMSRAIRATSHVALIEEARRKDPTAVVTVKIYKHAGLLPDGYSIDTQMYQTAELKDREIHRVLRLMKQCAIDCQIHRKRNIRPEDQDGSAECDYDICDYTCVNPSPPPSSEDFSTYDVYYSDEVVEQLLELLYDNFHVVDSIPISVLYQKYSEAGFRPQMLDLAIERLVDQKIPLTDRYGYRCFVREDEGSLFLVREYPLTDEAEYALSYYDRYNIVILPQSLQEYGAQLSTQQLDLWDRLNMLAKEGQWKEVDKALKAANVPTRADIVERVIQNIVKDQKSELDEYIYNLFRSSIFRLREPIELFERFQSELQTARQDQRGRRPTAATAGKRGVATATRVFEAATGTLREGDIMYIHNIYKEEVKLTPSSITSRAVRPDIRLRILKPQESPDWRDANSLEQIFYNTLIQLEENQRLESYRQYGVFGSILADGKFRIHDVREEVGGETNIRERARGLDCGSWKKPDLVDLLWEFQIAPPPIQHPKMSLEEQIRFLQENMPGREREVLTFPEDRLRYYIQWNLEGITKPQICMYLKNYLSKNERVYLEKSFP